MLKGSQLVGGSSKTRKRTENDFYATPPDATRMILREVKFSGANILEPACGQGHISKVLKEFYPDKEIISTDLIDRGYGIGGIDFLTYDYRKPIDNIITNPPFKLINSFIEKSLAVARKKVVLFGRLQVLESVSRYKLLINSPLKYVYIHVKRVTPYKNGSPVDEKGKPWNSTMAFAWFVWEQGYTGEPVVRFLI